MLDRKLFKKRARKMLIDHYAILVIACLFAAVLGTAYSSTLSQSRMTSENTISQAVHTGTDHVGLPNITEALDDLFGVKIQDPVTVDEDGQITAVGDVKFERSKGIFSAIMNKMASGGFFVILLETIGSIINSGSFGNDILIVLAALTLMFVSFFIRYTYSVMFRRVYLESYLYDTTKSSRFLFLYKARRVLKASLTIFLTALLQMLWNLTIIGGIIAWYNYMMIPYIVAENPDIDFREALRLSRRMVYGHRFDIFVTQLTFIPLFILGRFTLGITDILITNPYMECTMVQYYFKLRELAKQKKASYADKLNDVYLAQKPTYDLVEEKYDDVVEVLTNDIDVRDLKNDGFRGFIEDTLGIIYKYDSREDAYNVAVEEEEKIDDYHRILDLRQYPARLSPLYREDDTSRVETIHYLRHYSIWSIIALFFIFSATGWVYEVVIHLVRDGEFVNRGFLQGPWLPIYGSGAVAILMLLFRYRSKPLLEATLTVGACAFIEYMSSLILELTKGLKWWDYSGYFINLGGRICAEGLTVFLLAGIAAVYYLAPLIDNHLRKMNQHVLRVICIILLVVFSMDVAYSFRHPNTGKGITDYDDVSCVVEHNNR